jgi:hypothetical protein
LPVLLNQNNLIHQKKKLKMKKLLFVLSTFLLVASCHKKIETPNYSALIIGKWVCKSYIEDDSSKIMTNTPYSLTGHYENGWDFSENKGVRYRDFSGRWLSSGKDNYSLVGNKTLTLNQDDGNSVFLAVTFQITEFTANKLTVHNDMWKSTFFLTKEQ